MGRKLRALVIKGGKNSVHNLLYRPRTRLTRGVSRLPPVLFVFLSCCFLCVWFFFGLQDSLNKLSQYCQNWFLNIPNKRIEIVNDYTYLGVNFSSNGSFIRHKEKLQEKTRCSIFAFRRYPDPSKLSILKRLQQTFWCFIPSIRTYSSKVWGAYDKSENTTWEKDTIEKTQIKVCKVFLGVNKRSPNAASRNELGRLPLKIQITQNIIKYWCHLEGLQKYSIASLCLEISNKMAEEHK